MKEYVVSLNAGIDYTAFWNEMESVTQSLEFIPDRKIDIANNRDGSLRSCHYYLTDEESVVLQNDPRIYCVEIPPNQRTDIQIHTYGALTGDFTKPVSSVGGKINWGLVRSSNPTNVYGANIFPTANVYNYNYDGTGVDVVIQDSGIEWSHPEFYDANGNNRVQKINWYTASGLDGTQNDNHYRDFDGHGTHVAGIAVGKNYGWAKNANIYSVKVNGLEGAGDSGTGISTTDCFDVIKLWHRNKSVDNITGFKRPTIINMSWGYSYTLANSTIISMTYRGTTYPQASIPTLGNKLALGLTNYGSYNGADFQYASQPVRISSVDVDLQELTEEGVHIIAAAGNSYAFQDLADGVDYNNSISINVSPYTRYYHQGASPGAAANVICIGATDSTVYSAALDRKAIFSNKGPRIDIYAPGDQIMSTCSNTNTRSGVTYALGGNSNVYYRQTSMSGTSQASPQVCGVGALYLQKNPGVSPLEFKAWMTNTASISGIIYNSANITDYGDYYSILSILNKHLYSNVSYTIPPSIVGINGRLTLNNISIRFQ
jgi:subtilisin family serine protease